MVTLRGDALFRSVPLRLLQSLGVRRGSLEVLRDSEVFVALILQGLDFRGQTAHVVSGARAFAAALRVRATEVDCGSSRGRVDAECCAVKDEPARLGTPSGKPFRTSHPDARSPDLITWLLAHERTIGVLRRERTTKLPHSLARWAFGGVGGRAWVVPPMDFRDGDFAAEARSTSVPREVARAHPLDAPRVAEGAGFACGRVAL